jgi:hypothetical protein
MEPSAVILALAAPLFLILIGTVTKRLLDARWSRKHFFLGVELSIAAIATLLDHFLDLLRLIVAEETLPKGMAKDATYSGVLLVLSLVALLYALSLHRDWEKEEDRPKAQAFWLIFVANSLGAILLVVFALLVKR